MSLTRYFLAVAAIFIISLSGLYAETSMNLIYSIHFPDSLHILYSAPAGDFNVDGVVDLAVGVEGPTSSRPIYAAVFLYYGGFQFDTIPDLVFIGDSVWIGFGYDRFGYKIHGLDDFNGDGYDDMAIGAPAAFGGLGRIYIYYGSPEPDTIPDMIIEGQQFRDGLPFDMKSGDFNGDGLGDILTATNSPAGGPRVLIYLGGNPPDNLPDIAYWGDTWQQMGYLYNGSDINGDSYDDYGFYYADWFTGYLSAFYLGGPVLNEQPEIISSTYSFKFIDCDLNGDNIDDFLRTSVGGWYFCLGGNPVDTTPCCYAWSAYGNPFMYNLPGLGQVIINDEGNDQHRMAIYNASLPFDTIPVTIFNYNTVHYNCQPNIGDINADGIDEIALPFNDSNQDTVVNIYTITSTWIDDPRTLPINSEMLSCYPNPFNSSTIFKYPNNKEGELEIYNLLGQHVKALRISLNGGQVIWDGTNNNNELVPSGVYFAKVKASETGVGVKLLLLR